MSKIVPTIYHTGIMNVELYEKMRHEMMRVNKMQYANEDVNFNRGFQLGWIALQGGAVESATTSVALQRAMVEVEQLRRENASLTDRNKELEAQKVESQLSAPKTLESLLTPKPLPNKTLEGAVAEYHAEQQKVDTQLSVPHQTLDGAVAEHEKEILAKQLASTKESVGLDIAEPPATKPPRKPRNTKSKE